MRRNLPSAANPHRTSGVELCADVLLTVAGHLPVELRAITLCRLACCSRHYRQLCSSGEGLWEEVEAQLAGPDGLQAFAGWLAGKKGSVQRLLLTLNEPRQRPPRELHRGSAWLAEDTEWSSEALEDSECSQWDADAAPDAAWEEEAKRAGGEVDAAAAQLAGNELFTALEGAPLTHLSVTSPADWPCSISVAGTQLQLLQLQSLSLASSEPCDFGVFKLKGSFGHLTSLTTASFGIQDSLEHLPSSLQRLSLVPGTDQNKLKLPPAVPAATQLQSLTLLSTNCEPWGIPGLELLASLTSLVLDCTPGLVEERLLDLISEPDYDQDPRVDPFESHLTELAPLTRLRQLSLRHVRGVDDCLEWLPLLKDLAVLHLSYCWLPVEVHEVLSALTGLEELSLAGMDGMGTAGDIQDLAPLQLMPRLQRLDLRHCAFSESNPPELLSICIPPQLQALDLTDAGMSPEQAQQLFSTPQQQLAQLGISLWPASQIAEQLPGAASVRRVDLHLPRIMFGPESKWAHLGDAALRQRADSLVAALKRLPLLQAVRLSWDKPSHGNELAEQQQHESGRNLWSESIIARFGAGTEPVPEDQAGRQWLCGRLAQELPGVQVVLRGPWCVDEQHELCFGA